MQIQIQAKQLQIHHNHKLSCIFCSRHFLNTRFSPILTHQSRIIEQLHGNIGQTASQCHRDGNNEVITQVDLVCQQTLAAEEAFDEGEESEQVQLPGSQVPT